MWARVKRFGANVAYTIQLLMVCGVVTTLTLGGSYVFALNDQGHDLLESYADGTTGSGLLQLGYLVFALAFWSLISWYSAWVTLWRMDHGLPSKNSWTDFARAWLPRILGAFPTVSIAIGFALIHDYTFAIVGGLYALLVSFLLFKRESYLLAQVKETAGYLEGARMAPLAKKYAFIAVGLAVAAVVVIVYFPVGPAQVVGTPGIIASAFALWILIGQLGLICFFLARKLPAMVIPLALFAILISSCNDNHSLHRATGFDPARERQLISSRPSLDQYFERWIVKQQRDEFGKIPAYVVASQGGGLRAAYWTAATLGRLHDQTEGRFSESVFAISAVSGGALGATVYASLISDDLRQNATSKTSVEDRSKRILGRDFLSPLVAYLLFADIAQRFIPFRIDSLDRSIGLEAAWEKGLRESGSLAADQSFLALWDLPSTIDETRVPALFLNATWVEGGMRMLVSNVRLGDMPFDGPLDSEATGDGRYENCLRSSKYASSHIDIYCEGLDTVGTSVTSAVHLSARFPYVSPAARVDLTDAERQARQKVDREKGKPSTSSIWGHVVDGGYFENSGAVTAAEILEFLRVKQKQYPDLDPTILLITNDAGQGLKGPLRLRQTPVTWLDDLAAPPIALLATRSARGDDAQEVLQRLAPGSYRRAPVVRSEDGYIAPLGWYLSKTARHSLDVRLNEDRGSGLCFTIQRFKPDISCI